MIKVIGRSFPFIPKIGVQLRLDPKDRIVTRDVVEMKLMDQDPVFKLSKDGKTQWGRFKSFKVNVFQSLLKATKTKVGRQKKHLHGEKISG
jgi:hypothetical protein